MIETLRWLWLTLDLDERDAHFYGGLVLVAIGAGMAYLPAGFIAFGAGLMYPAVRRPAPPPGG